MSNLYELTNDFLEIQYLAEITEDEQKFMDTLESLEMAIEDKLENTAKVIKNIEAQITALKVEETRLSNRRKPLQNSVIRLKDNVFQSMKVTNKRKIVAGTFQFSIAKNPATLNIKDESEIPEEFFVLKPAILDKAKVKSYLKSGGKIVGAELIQTEGVRIK